jgi:hypothetical protein
MISQFMESCPAKLVTSGVIGNNAETKMQQRYFDTCVGQALGWEACLDCSWRALTTIHLSNSSNRRQRTRSDLRSET